MPRAGSDLQPDQRAVCRAFRCALRAPPEEPVPAERQPLSSLPVLGSESKPGGLCPACKQHPWLSPAGRGRGCRSEPGTTRLPMPTAHGPPWVPCWRTSPVPGAHASSWPVRGSVGDELGGVGAALTQGPPGRGSTCIGTRSPSQVQCQVPSLQCWSTLLFRPAGNTEQQSPRRHHSPVLETVLETVRTARSPVSGTLSELCPSAGHSAAPSDMGELEYMFQHV